MSQASTNYRSLCASRPQLRRLLVGSLVFATASTLALTVAPGLLLPPSASGVAPTTTTTATAVTTTSSTTSTTIAWPPPCGETGMDGRVTATDALYVLKAAVGAVPCLYCLCDVDDSGGITATDALRVLKYAVGITVQMTCPVCAPAVCGDDLVNRAGEQCDGTDDGRCPGLCQGDCKCAAPSCGDQVINQTSETCDGTDDDLCPTLCQFDCTCPAPSCGNDVKEQGETCDGTDTGDQTCNTLGFAGGTLRCAPGCTGFDTTACTLPGQLPPDPASVAPSVDPTVATDVKSATEFLYSGSDPVQYGVLAETIDVRRAALVRGQVRDESGAALSGVEIRVLLHPELGATQTRTDGNFDLVVNGGGPLTLTYEKTGYLPAQRQITAGRQATTSAPDVGLLQVDSVVTTVDLASSTPIQVHQASLVSDAAGDRRATLMFSQGTQAEMVMADGTRQAIATLSVRATEYTDDAAGEEAMPAELPPNSAYTYAFELSADEAIAAGAKDVEFDRPVVFYVDNFLQGTAGMTVPVGYYDRIAGQWKPSKSGVIVKVISITSGMADLDTDGDGVADAQATLDALGITDAERTALAGLHAAGESLWRIEVEHFSSWDANWGWGPPDDASYPDQEDPEEDIPEEEPCQVGGSIIECESQVLGEELPVAGTEFTLNYRSNRVPGRKADSTLHIPLTGASVPASLTGVEVEILVAGRKETYSVGRDHPCLREPPLIGTGTVAGLSGKQSLGGAGDPRAAHVVAGTGDPIRSRTNATVTDITNQSYDFTWDGKDAYGRTLQGQQPVTVKVGFTYCGGYRQTSRFGYNGGGTISGSRTRRQVTLWRTWNGAIGPWDNRALGLGGWSLDVHHVYDPVGRTLYLGDGSQRSAEAMPTIINTVAGLGRCPVTLCGTTCPCTGPADQTYIHDSTAMAVGQDGTIYVAALAASGYSGGAQIVAIRDGLVTKIAGGPGYWYGGDGGPAIYAQFPGVIYSLAVGPDGSIYASANNGNRVRRIGPDGIITTVAGNGQPGKTGDGGPATEATLQPYTLAVGPDGSLYIGGWYRVRRVAPDGTIDTFAGNGIEADGPDGVPADQSSIAIVGDIAVGPDGSVYIATCNSRYGGPGTGCAIRQVRPDGIITTVARSGGFSFGEGIPASDAAFGISDINVLGNGDVIFSDGLVKRVLKIDDRGILTRIAGRVVLTWPPGGFDGDGGPAAAALIQTEDLVLSPDGAFYLLGGDRVRRIGAALPGVSPTAEIALPSEDGNAVYVFDGSGQHLRTMHALTGAVLYSFAYDTRGLLATVTDGDGNQTTVERDGLGNPTAIVGPYGQRTALTTDANGWLSSVANPLNDTVGLTHASDGLLTGLTDPRSNVHTFAYDAQGLLTRDDDPAGGYQTLTRTKIAGGYEVAKTSALGRTTIYRYEKLADGSRRRTVVFPDSVSNSLTVRTDATLQATRADGSTEQITLGNDQRLGLSAPLMTQRTFATPGGVTSNSTYTRSESLTEPSNIFSVTTQTDTLTVNGSTYTRIYDGATRTFLTTSPEGRTHTVTIDAQERIVEEQIGTLEPTAYTYDERGRLSAITRGTGGGARTTTFGYGTDGYLATVSEPLGTSLAYAFDPADHIVRITPPGRQTASMTYDASGNTTAIAGPGASIHSFSYTSIDRIASYVPPQVGSTMDAVIYTHNVDRQTTAVDLPDATTAGFSYDAAGQLVNVDVPGFGIVALSYHPTSGRPTRVTAPGGDAIDYVWDGPLLTGVHFTGQITATVDVTYDSDLQVATTAVNGETPVSFGYDGDGLMTSAGSMTLAYDANGLLTGTALDKSTDEYTYDGFGQIASYRSLYNGTEIYAYVLTRDALGRIVQKSETIGGTTAAFDYVYDSAGRLAEVRKNAALVESYAYDGRNNRTVSTTSSATINATYDARDRLISYGSAQYSYSPIGALEQVVDGTATTTYEYDSAGALHRVTLPDSRTIEYVIDGFGRRIGRKTGATLEKGWIYDHVVSPVAEFDAAGSVTARFVSATRPNVPDYLIKGGRTYRLVADDLGSPRLVVDTGDGTITQRIDYDSFGRVTTDTNPGFQPFGFAGGFYDGDTGLTRFGARDYDAGLGRWTARDPILFAGEQFNLYAYVNDDPVNELDPTGTGFFNRCWQWWKQAYGIKKHVDKIDKIKSEADFLRKLRRNKDYDRTVDSMCDKLGDHPLGLVYKSACKATGKAALRNERKYINRPKKFFRKYRDELGPGWGFLRK